jgi:cell division protein FtsI (penicillin-binding protein 3)
MRYGFPQRGSNGSDDTALLGQAKFRLFIVAAVFLLGYLAVSLRLVDLTLIRTAAEKAPNKVSFFSAGEAADNLPLAYNALRGTIVDRNGDLVATSLKMASVYADATLIENPKKTAAELAKILPAQKESDILAKLSSGKKFVWIERNITPRQEYAVNTLGNPGLAFKHESRRVYPNNNLLSHLVGYTDIDGHGISGIEKSYEKTLNEGEEPVKLTIDLRIQHILHRELSQAVQKFSAKAAIGMVMDVNTGDVIATVSLPDFDPHYPEKAPDDARFNRATLGVYEMGSTFKLFSTAAVLDSGMVNFGTQYDTVEPIKQGRFTIRDYHAKKRPLTIPEIFIYSSNIGTAKMAMTIGTGALKDFYKSLGFLDTMPVTLPERGKPLYPAPWRDVNTLTASFGHGIAVSPLHLMAATSALVNGGIMVKPSFVHEGEGAKNPLAPVGARVVKTSTSDQIRKLLELVVVSGTGSKGKVEGYNVGGKTGTAEKTMGRGYNRSALLSSFVGVFPVEAPRYVVLAILDEPQPTKESYGYATGGWTAAPVVAKVIEQMAPLYQIPPDLDSGRNILRDMARYLREVKEGSHVAAVGTDR